MWNEIAYLFPNFNGYTDEVWKWIYKTLNRPQNFNDSSVEIWKRVSNLIPYFTSIWVFFHAEVKVFPC